MHPTRYRYSKTRVLLLIIFLLLITCALLYGGYKGFQKFWGNAEPTAEEVIKLVSKIAETPQGETPVVSIIINLESLKEQSFFKDALVGDRVLIYKEAQMAYLFRPKTSKLIAISPILD